MIDKEEFTRWYKIALQTLDSAKLDMKGEFYNWACFKFHQSAEFALKALLRGIGEPSYGHSIYKLLEKIRDIGIDVPNELILRAKNLDQYYVPTRYPDAWVDGSPFEYYTDEDAKRALSNCEAILGWVDEIWRKLLREGGKRGEES